MNRDRALLLLYLGTVLVATLVHAPAVLAGGLALTLLAAGREARSLLRRAVLAVAAFNVLVSLGYGLMAWLQHLSPWETLLRLNLRVLWLTCVTFLFTRRANLFRALDFSRTLTYVLGLAYSQTMAFRRAQEDFRMALASRSLRRPGMLEQYRSSAAAASWFLEKALHAATQSSHALRSRGFFRD